MFIKLVMSQR